MMQKVKIEVAYNPLFDYNGPFIENGYTSTFIDFSEYEQTNNTSSCLPVQMRSGNRQGNREEDKRVCKET
jgi:hypothetical protein